jgi:coiled-coil domain-containing protein 55
MQTGETGKKYGLILNPGRGAGRGASAPQNRARPPPPGAVANVFGADDEDDEIDVAKDLERQQAKKRSDAKVSWPDLPHPFPSSSHTLPYPLFIFFPFMHNPPLNPFSQVAEMHRKALEEDPSVFDYDGVYDDLQQARAQPRMQDKAARQPKYIQNLLDKAQERKMEQDILFEKRLVSGLGRRNGWRWARMR